MKLAPSIFNDIGFLILMNKAAKKLYIYNCLNSCYKMFLIALSFQNGIKNPSLISMKFFIEYYRCQPFSLIDKIFTRFSYDDL